MTVTARTQLFHEICDLQIIIMRDFKLGIYFLTASQLILIMIFRDFFYQSSCEMHKFAKFNLIVQKISLIRATDSCQTNPVF